MYAVHEISASFAISSEISFPQSYGIGRTCAGFDVFEFFDVLRGYRARADFTCGRFIFGICCNCR